MSAISRREAMALIPGGFAAAAAVGAVHEGVPAPALAVTEPDRGPFDLEPRRVWSAPKGERVVSLVVFDGNLYVGTERGLYVHEGARA